MCVIVLFMASHAWLTMSTVYDMTTVHACADPKTWQPAVESQASSLAAGLMAYLATKCHLFSSLARLLLGACPATVPATGQPPAQMSMPEALASNLTVRFLSLKGHPEVAAAQITLPRLLCVPLLWSRCPRVLLSVRHLLLPWPKHIWFATLAVGTDVT